MRKKLLGFVFAAGLLVALAVPLFGSVGTVSAHVHGITPLNQCTVDNTNSGADASPLSGLIVRDLANSPLDLGDGGFNAPVQCP